MALKWPHAEKNLAEFSPRKFSPKTSESTKNGLKREINKKNRKKKFSPQGTHDEKKLRKILALPSKLFPLSSASKGMAMDFFGGLTPLDCRAPVNPAYRKIAPPPPTHLILAKTSTTPKLGRQWWTYIGNWSVDLSETGLWTYCCAYAAREFWPIGMKEFRLFERLSVKTTFDVKTKRGIVGRYVSDFISPSILNQTSQSKDCCQHFIFFLIY